MSRSINTKLLLLLIAVLALSGCGGDDEPAPRPVATQAAVALDDDALLGVHDAFVSCANKHDVLGLTVGFRDGQAVTSTGEGAGGGQFDDRVSAPKTIGALLEEGKAQYVGLRSGKGWWDVDLLFLKSHTEAAAAVARLAQEGRNAFSDGRFVALDVDPENEARDVPPRAREALEACLDEAGV